MVWGFFPESDENVCSFRDDVERAADRFFNFLRKNIQFVTFAVSDIGVHFAASPAVSSFRRSALLSAVATWLVLLGVSPVTAPFSTFSFVDIGHHGATVVQKTGESLKANNHNVFVTDTIDGRPEMARLVDGPIGVPSRAPAIERVLPGVLRI
jgi:hypothetical protein